MLNVEKLDAFYGKKQILFGIDMALAERRIAAVIGPNGAVKSTVLRALFGTPEAVSYARPGGDGQLLAVLEYSGGVPCVLEIGVGTSYAWWDEWIAVHGNDEFLRIDSLVPRAQACARAILRLEQAGL